MYCGCSSTVICLLDKISLTDSAVCAVTMSWCRIDEFPADIWGLFCLTFLWNFFGISSSTLDLQFTKEVETHYAQFHAFDFYYQNFSDIKNFQFYIIFTPTLRFWSWRNTHDLLPVIMWLNKSSCLSRRSWQNSILLWFLFVIEFFWHHFIFAHLISHVQIFS